jgi:predicted nucleic acid-binding protein
MNFASLPPGATVFLDANTLVYHFSAHPVFGPSCVALLDRIEKKECHGVTSTHLLAEMAHKLMTVEAHQRLNWPIAGIANRLRRHPKEVQQLSAYRQAIDDIHAIGIDVQPNERNDLSLAADVSRQYGLLTNDALTIVLMRKYGYSMLASADSDFDIVPGFVRYSPT